MQSTDPYQHIRASDRQDLFLDLALYTTQSLEVLMQAAKDRTLTAEEIRLMECAARLASTL